MRLLAATALTATLLLLLSGGPGAAQDLRLTFERQPDEPTSLVLAGTLSNDSSRDVVDVWVTAEALNAGGRVVGRGLAFASPLLRGRASTKFTVKLPRVEQAQSFRVFVSSFRYLAGAESP
ncbi:MAG TPA: FxLYD domain-containing protein [Methylomirabilota bacterium]|jgi:hypothetical protein|nr:FxLYD domain-containing protein [Methylomirabilota bacterium]